VINDVKKLNHVEVKCVPNERVLVDVAHAPTLLHLTQQPQDISTLYIADRSDYWGEWEGTQNYVPYYVSYYTP